MAKMDIKELEQLVTKYKDGTISQDEFIDRVNASGDKGLIRNVKILFDRLEWEASEIEKYRVENKMDEAKCDMCGRKLKYWDCNQDFVLEHSFQYGSRYEMAYIKAHLCNDCMDKVFDNILPMFKKNPLKFVDIENDEEGRLVEVVTDKEYNI